MRVVLPFTVALVAAALTARMLAGAGFVNYDTFYSLLWGERLAAGLSPQLDIALAPTPKPAVIALGLALAPVGHAAIPITVFLAFLALGGLALAAFLLAGRFGGLWAGALASLLVLTREPILSFGARAYVDVAYVALVLGALAVEVDRQRISPRPGLAVRCRPFCDPRHGFCPSPTWPGLRCPRRDLRGWRSRAWGRSHSPHRLPGR